MNQHAKCSNHKLPAKKRQCVQPVGGAGAFAGIHKTFICYATIRLTFISCGDSAIDKKGRQAVISQIDILKKIVRDHLNFVIIDNYNGANCRIGFDYRSPPSDVDLKLDPSDDNKRLPQTVNDIEGNWSYIGADNLDITGKTMNIDPRCLDNPGIIMHVLCHLIGLGHEHQHPDGCIAWNVNEVIKYYSGPPHNLSNDYILANILNRKSNNDIWIGTAGYDSKSIMNCVFDEKLVDEKQTKTNYRQKYPNLSNDEIDEKYLKLFKCRNTLSSDDISSIQKFYEVETILVIRFYSSDDNMELMKASFECIIEYPNEFIDTSFSKCVFTKAEILEVDVETLCLTIKSIPDTNLWRKGIWEKIFYLHGIQVDIDKISIQNMYDDKRLHQQ